MELQIPIPPAQPIVAVVPLKPRRNNIDPKTKDRLLRFFIIKCRKLEWTAATKNAYIKALNAYFEMKTGFIN